MRAACIQKNLQKEKHHFKTEGEEAVSVTNTNPTVE